MKICEQIFEIDQEAESLDLVIDYIWEKFGAERNDRTVTINVFQGIKEEFSFLLLAPWEDHQSVRGGGRVENKNRVIFHTYIKHYIMPIAFSNKELVGDFKHINTPSQGC